MAAELPARFVSPARCAERPWDQWARELGRAAPRADPAPPAPKAAPRARLLRLRRAAMALHGLLPARALRAALCPLCGAAVLPAAALAHLAAAHPAAPAACPPPAAAPRRRRRDPPLHVRLETGQLPVVSIAEPEPEELPLGDHLADDIFAIMNSEGIQSADDVASATDWRNIIRDIGDLQELSFAQPEPAPEAAPPASPRRARARPARTKFSLREYDANKHCGVLTAEGRPCTRSLTCKAHALSLRRTVEGRAKPFDALLAEHRAAREAAAPPPLELPPELAALGDAQVDDLYSLLGEGPHALLHDPRALEELLDAPAAPEEAPPERLREAPAVERVREAPVERGAREAPTVERVREAPSDVCWYAACPRPLAVCTYNAAHAGGAVTLGKKFATVRANIKSSLSRSQCKSTGGTNNFYYGQSGLSLSKVHVNAGRAGKPEVRRLIVCSGARESPGEFGPRGLNGHVGSVGKQRPLKHKLPAPVLDLGFSLDPLLTDEKC